MPFTLKKIAMRLRNDSEYIPLPGVRGDAGPGVPAGGTTGQVLAKSSNTDYATTWVNQSGGGGTSDYTDLTNKPSINDVTLSGNKTAAELGLATPSDIPTVPVQSVNNKTGAVTLSASDVGAGTYSKPSGGIPKSDLASAVQTSLGKADSALQSVPSTYRTSAAQDAIDIGMAKADEVGIVITGKRPSIAVTAGQYVIVRNSTISGITDGLYTANAALSPSTNVTAANLSAVNNGGLNAVRGSVKYPIHRLVNGASTTVQSGASAAVTVTIPTLAGYTPHVMSGHISDTTNANYAKVQIVWSQSDYTINAHIGNASGAQVTLIPRFEVLYIPD